MVITSGKVVAGQIILDGDPLPDGAVVTVLSREGDETFTLDAAAEASALLTVEYLEARGQRGSRASFDRILSRVPNVPPVPGDELPPQPRQFNKALQPTSRGTRRLKAPRARSSRG